MPPITRPFFFAGWIMICLVTQCPQRANAASNRVEIEGLVSADPVPQGYKITRKDAKNGEKIVGDYLILTKEGSSTRALIQIDRREITERPARVAALKAYVNAAASVWQRQGYALDTRTLPKLETIDFGKPVAIDLSATKNGEKTVLIHLEVFFDRYAYETMCVSTDATQANGMMTWCKSVRPLTVGSATRPAQ